MAWDTRRGEISVTTPVTAELFLPNRAMEVVEPGSYSFPLK